MERGDSLCTYRGWKAPQNVQFQATARGLVPVFVSAFDGTCVQNLWGLPPNHVPLSLLFLGLKQ